MEMKQQLASTLWQLGCIQRAKAGEKGWTLKSGDTSNVYVDLRILPQHPHILSQIAEAMSIDDFGAAAAADYLAGLPLGGIPLATVLSQHSGIPQILIRKVAKDHGTTKMVEADYGNWDGPRTVILVDDVFTTGSTVCETMTMLEQQKIPLTVVGVVCVVNRSKPHIAFVPSTTIPVHSLFDYAQLFQTRKSFEMRARTTNNAATARLFEIMSKKKTNLCFSADFEIDTNRTEETSIEIVELFRQIVPYIAMVKIHHDLLPTSVLKQIWLIAAENDVMVLSDDKFADIGSIVGKKLVGHAPAHLFTIHGIAGPGGIDELDDCAVLVAEMSNDGALTNNSFFAKMYAKQIKELIERRPNAVVGIVCQNRGNCDVGDDYVYMTPGVNETASSDGRDQRYRSCHKAIVEQKNDIVIVGRGICKSRDVTAAATMYRDAAWKAYESDVSLSK